MATETRPASSIVLCHGSGAARRFLMGLRAETMVFMPGAAVFPGGREEDNDQLASNTPTPATLPGADRFGPRLERGLAAASRELTEETGLVLSDLSPASAPICFATATTPPFQPRRYSTLFYLCQVQNALSPPGGDAELNAVAWYSMDEIDALPTMGITRRVLKRALEVLDWPKTSPDTSAPPAFVDLNALF